MHYSKYDYGNGLTNYKYKWRVYYETSLLHESDDLYDEEEDAMDEAKDYVESKIKDYEIDESYYDRNSFDIVILEEECDEDEVF